MPMKIYAAPADLAAWTGTDLPDNAASLLRSASILVAKASYRDIYTDNPDASDAAVLNDATCAQAASWIALGIDPAAVGLDRVNVTTSKIGSGSVTKDNTGALAATQMAATQLAPQAEQILYSGGLLYTQAPVTDEAPYLARYGLSLPRFNPFSPYDPELQDYPPELIVIEAVDNPADPT